MKPRVLFLVGPTATGKSNVAIELAKRLGGEIISADSMQIYTGMDIGTAKPSLRDRNAVQHHLINIAAPSRTFSVFEYRSRALSKIRELIQRGRVPIVVGGSGLYIRALLQGLSGQPGPDHAFRKRLEQEAKKGGLARLCRWLEKIDPKTAGKIRRQDQRRIIRALEIASVSRKKPSEWYRKRESLKALGFQPVVVGLTREREALYEDIERRVDRMFRQGFVREVERLSRKRFSKTAAQAVGYKELREALKGKMSFEEAEAQIKRNTRRLAKRQITWFKREAGLRWFCWRRGESVTMMVDRILEYFHAS